MQLASFAILAVAVSITSLAMAGRQPFTDDLADAAAWHTNAADAPVRVVDAPREGSTRGLEWTLPPMRPQVFWLQRALPVTVDNSYVIRFAVSCPEPMPLEVQIAGEDAARLYSIVYLDRPGWCQVSVNVGQMHRFAGFTPEHFARTLYLRFWVDGSPGWAGGRVPRDRELKLTLADISVTSPLADLPEGTGGRLKVNPGHVTGTVHPHVYGHFLEHIYHSVEDGLFGELVRNRAFVGPEGFRLADGLLTQTSLRTDVKVFAGDPSWTDYEFSLQARKTAGAEGFLIIFRAANERNFYWWNLGGWGNVRHALEVQTDSGRHITGPQPEGHIELDRWYDIRVRVEKDHIQGWLDGDKLLDLRDTTHVHGGVGLGTWATAAQFRHITVTDLAGNALPVDFSHVGGSQSTPEEWSAFPADTAEALSLQEAPDSPNTGWAARVELGKYPGPHGLAQHRYNLVAGHVYSGVAWLRAEGQVDDTTVSVLAGDGSVLDSQPLNPGRERWTECRFELRPSRSDPHGTLALTARGSGVLLVDMVSLMRDDYLSTGCRTDLLEAVRALKPPIIRWPGGCFASIYRWKRGIGPQHERKPFYNLPWGEWDSGGFGTDEFIRLCREVEAEPLIVLNLGSWDSPQRWQEYLQEALEWVEYCNGDASTPMGRLRARYGHPEPYNVTHWELDNETWGMGVDGYAQRLLPFARAIKQRWPQIKLYACSFGESGDPQLIQQIGQYVDLMSYHLYDDPNTFALSPLSHEAIWARYAGIFASGPNPHLKLAVTEWNAQSTDWRTGLFAGGLLNVMERMGTVEMASPALFLRRVDAPAWDNAFINHDHVTWFPAPNYVVMKLYREHFQPTRVACEYVGPLNVVATVSEDRSTVVLKVVNYGPEDIVCQVEVAPEFAVRDGRAWVVQGRLEDRNTLADPARIAPRQLPLPEVGNQFRYPFGAYSVTVLELLGG